MLRLDKISPEVGCQLDVDEKCSIIFLEHQNHEGSIINPTNHNSNDCRG